MEMPDLMNMSQAELDELFEKSPPGPIPEGNAAGTAIVWPGTLWTRLIARFVHDFAWQGKIFWTTWRASYWTVRLNHNVPATMRPPKSTVRTSGPLATRSAASSASAIRRSARAPARTP